MSVIIRLQNLPLTANSIDIRNFFRGLSIPDGGVHIVGGTEGDAFIAFGTDEDARQGMQLSGTCLKDVPVKLLLSSRNEMYKVIEQARQQALGIMPPASSGNSPVENSNLASSSLSQNPVAASSIMNSSVSGLHLGISSSTTSILPLGVFPGPGTSSNSSLSFPTLNGSVGSGGLPNFASILTGQPPPNLQGMFASHPPPPAVTQSSSVNNMSQRVLPPNLNPFSFPPGNGANLPVSHHSNMQSNPMANSSVPVYSMANLSNPNFVNLSSMGTSVHQFGNVGAPRIPILSAGLSGISTSSVSHSPQGFTGMTVIPTIANSTFGGGSSNTAAGTRPSSNGTHVSQSSSDPSTTTIRDRRNEEKTFNTCGKQSSGSPSTNQASSSFRPDIRERDRERNDRRGSPSRSKERKEIRARRRSRSRDRSKDRRRDRRSASRSRSHSRDRDRTRSRRSSRDRVRDERRRSDALVGNPEKSHAKRDTNALNGNKYSMNDQGRTGRESNPVEVVTLTDDNYGCAKLSGVHRDASYREIREFIRVDVEGGGEGVVRNYEKGFAYIKLSQPEDYSRLLRQSGQKLRGTVVKIEGVSTGLWQNEYKSSRRQTERENEQRDRDRDYRDRDRGDRPRPSRFNGRASQSSCISIRSLPVGITARDVASSFFKDVNVLDIAVMPQLSSNGGSNCTAYVQLDSANSAQNSVDLIVKSCEGSSYVVEFCEPHDIQRAKNDFNRPSERDPESTSVVLAGVPIQANEKDILDFFSDIGLTPQNVRRLYDSNGLPDNKIVCQFDTASKARRATTKDGTLFGRNAAVSVSLWPTRSDSHGPANNHLNVPSSHNSNPFNAPGGRPALLGPRPTIMNVGSRFSSMNSQNPFQQALNMSALNPMMMISQSSSMRGPTGERPPRFQNSNNGGRISGDRQERNSHGPDGVDDMAVFEKPGCVIALENVPYKANMDDILNFLQDKLRVPIPRNRIIRRFDDNQKPTGDARVAFQTSYEAKIACQKLGGSYMWKRPISASVLPYF